MKLKHKTLILLGSLFLIFFLVGNYQQNPYIAIDNNNEIHNYTYERDEENVNIEMLKCSVKEEWDQSWRWHQTGSIAEDIIIDEFNNVYTMGTTEEPSTYIYHIAIIKYNSEGEYQWNKTWCRTDGDVEGRAMARDTAGNFYVAGFFYNYTSEDDNFLLVKFDSSGEYQWDKVWGSSYQEHGNGIALDTSNNIYIAGEIRDEPYADGNNITIISFDSTGSHRWNHTLGYGDDDDGAFDITVDCSNDIYIAGYTQSYETYGDPSDFIVFKYDSSGVQLWNSTWGTNDNDNGYGIAVDSEFNVFVAGQSETSGNNPQPVIFKLNRTGSYEWNYTWQSPTLLDGGKGYDIAIGADNDVYFVGYLDTSEPLSDKDNDILVAKFNNSGTMLWNKTFDHGTKEEEGYSIALDSDENIYIAGYKRINNFWFFLTLKISQMPGEFVLSSNSLDPDLDGNFALTWSKSDAADNYSVYEHSSYIYEVNATIKIDEGLTGLSYQFSDKDTDLYYYKIVSFNKWGNESSNCIEVNVTRFLPEPFTLSSNSNPPNVNGSFTIFWDISEYAENYSLYQNSSYINEFEDSIKIDEGLTNQLYIFTGLSNGTYYFRLLAFNSNGNTSSNCIQIEVERFPPYGFTLDSDANDPDGDGSFTLNWTQSLYAENYSIYQHNYYITETNDTIKIAEGVESLTYSLNDLSEGTYYFRVVAFNINGNSTSNCIQVEVINAPPGPFEFNHNASSPETFGYVRFWWNQSLDADNYTLYMDKVPITDFNKNVFNITFVDVYSYIMTLPINGDYYFRLVSFNRNGNCTFSTDLIVNVRLAPKPLTLTSDADTPTDSDGNFKLNWSIAVEYSFFNVDITNYSLYCLTQAFTLDDIGIVVGIDLLKSNITTLNFNCTSYQDGTYYFMIVAYNAYGNSSSNCLEIVVSHPIVSDGDGGSGGDNDETEDDYVPVIIVGSIIAGVSVVSTVGIILHKKKVNRLKTLSVIAKNIKNPEAEQKPQQDNFDI